MSLLSLNPDEVNPGHGSVGWGVDDPPSNCYGLGFEPVEVGGVGIHALLESGTEGSKNMEFLCAGRIRPGIPSLPE